MAEPTKGYAGRKITVVIPLDVFEKLEDIAQAERRTIASTAVNLIIDGLSAREPSNAPTPPDSPKIKKQRQ